MNLKLKSAILIWKSGQEITVDHWFKLTELGFDPSTLERKHLR